MLLVLLVCIDSIIADASDKVIVIVIDSAAAIDICIALRIAVVIAIDLHEFIELIIKHLIIIVDLRSWSTHPLRCRAEPAR